MLENHCIAYTVTMRMKWDTILMWHRVEWHLFSSEEGGGGGSSQGAQALPPPSKLVPHPLKTSPAVTPYLELLYNNAITI